VSPIPKAVPLQRLSKVGLTLCVEALYACVLNTGTTLFVQNQIVKSVGRQSGTCKPAGWLTNVDWDKSISRSQFWRRSLAALPPCRGRQGR
ncbi:hypothetical protein, partial [Vacuolonema iberomarrocanum]|uniref:hypothetical protein n=1 Tax=Vacuolonema iberomarrocanum TaxID=3454632 RepID=UPI003F6DC003